MEVQPAAACRFPVCRRLTEPGQIQPGEVAGIGEGRRQAGLKLGRREVQETAGGAVGESRMDSFRGRSVQGRAVGTGGLVRVEMALGR